MSQASCRHYLFPRKPQPHPNETKNMEKTDARWRIVGSISRSRALGQLFHFRILGLICFLTPCCTCENGEHGGVGPKAILLSKAERRDGISRIIHYYIISTSQGTMLPTEQHLCFPMAILLVTRNGMNMARSLRFGRIQRTEISSGEKCREGASKVCPFVTHHRSSALRGKTILG